MAWGFLNKVKDVFDADTQEDQRKRLAKGEARYYDDQQRSRGNKAPASNPVEQTRNLAVSTARGIARIPETVGRSSAQAGADITAKIKGVEAPKLSSGKVTDPVRRALYGEEPVETYQQRTEGYKKSLESGESVLNIFGESGKEAGQAHPGAFAFLGAGLAVAGDATGGGKKEVGEKIVKSIAEDTTTQGIKKTLKNKVPDTVISDVSQPLSITKDPNITKNILAKVTGTTPDPNTGDSILGGIGLRGVTDPQSLQVAPPPQSLASATVPSPGISGEVIPPASADPFTDITDALNGRAAAPGQSPQRGITSMAAEQAGLLRKERAQRFGKSEGMGTTDEGSAGYFKERSALKGEYSKVSYGGMVEDIGPARAEDLFSRAREQVKALPDSVYEDMGLYPKSARFNTQTALRKVIFGEGGLPTKSEIKLIRAVSPGLADDIASKIPKESKFMDLVSKLAGLPRGLQSGLDLSMGGRQGIVVAARHPVIWARANKESVKYLADEQYYKNSMTALRKTPEYEVGQRYGLATPAADAKREEAYAAADWAEKVPGIKRSARAYEGGLTKMRSDLWADSLAKFGGAEQAEKALGEKGMRGLAEAINTLTGRGGKKGGFIDKHATSLGEALFSPRLWASRLQPLNPAYWNRIGSAGRKEALQSMGSFAALASIVLGAAVASGADVETDPRSSDFLKIKAGDTRYDILGGFQQNLVFAARQLSGERKSSQSGNITKFALDPIEALQRKTDEEAGVSKAPGTGNRLTATGDIVSNKLAPVPGAALRLIAGEDKVGNKINPATEIGQLFVPLNLQGTYDAIKGTGSVPQGVAKTIPGVFGFGSQTYGTKDIKVTEGQQKLIDKLKTSGAPPEQVEATQRFYQFQKTAPNKTTAGSEIKKALEDNDIDTAVRLAKAYNQKYKDAFKDWKKKYGNYTQDEQIQKDYRSKLITDDTIDTYIANIEKERE